MVVVVVFVVVVVVICFFGGFLFIKVSPFFLNSETLFLGKARSTISIKSFIFPKASDLSLSQ